MNEQAFFVRPVRVWDLFTLTRMTFDNMAGVDRELARIARHPLLHLFGYLLLPIYLLTAGRGIKAVRQGQIVGCAYLHVRRLSGLVFNVNVNRSQRRQGIGRALMQRLEVEICRQGRNWLGLQVDRGNLPARMLYEGLGYRAYNSYFLRTHERSIMRRAPLPGVRAYRLRRRDGNRLFAQYSDLERREGDAWAADVVKADFEEGPPSGGAFWQCFFGAREIGCAWVGGKERHPLILLLLQPEYWDSRTTTVELVRALLDEVSYHPESVDVHLGSSKHYDAALPTLQEFGFGPQEQKRTLMLKKVGEEAQPITEPA